ncbi:ParB/RepB/Spo0J family partition protein [Microbacterium rhizophilus]|uniref:ParB/RepB/Spo0J family partition protein n=1 Tax=Microbacterium rhizophilus TaxID=3138934 RepID=UPI0031EC4D2D
MTDSISLVDRSTAKKPTRSRKPIPTVDTTGTTSAVDALAEAPATSPTLAVDQIVHVDPTTLLIGPNVRKTTDPEAYKALVGSIAELGVLEAVTAFVTEDGQLEIVTGQTRTNAAVEAGATSIPVRIIAKPESTTLAQLVENTARAPMTRADQVAAAKQLAFDFKLPAAQIAKRTTLARKDIDHALKVADAPVALAGLDKDGLSLELLAAVADSGLTEEEAKPVFEARWNPEMELQRAVRNKEIRVAVQSETDKHRAAGVQVTKVAPTDDYGTPNKDTKAAWVRDLIDAKTEKQVSAKEHENCPGHAVWIGQHGYHHDTNIDIMPVCLDPKAHGHALAAGRAAAGKPQMSDEEKALKKQNTHLNKAWPEVTEVRLDWIRDHLLPLKKLPNGWQLFIADDLMSEHEHYTAHLGLSGNPVVLNRILALGVRVSESEHQTGYRYVSTSDVASRFRAELAKRPDHAILALAIQRHESAMEVRGGWEKLSPRYMQWLVDNGYRLTEEEQIILDRRVALEGKRRAGRAEDEAAAESADDEGDDFA